MMQTIFHLMDSKEFIFCCHLHWLLVRQTGACCSVGGPWQHPKTQILPGSGCSQGENVNVRVVGVKDGGWRVRMLLCVPSTTRKVFM